MRFFLFRAACFGVLVMAIFGCGRGYLPSGRPPEKLTLYSIDGNSYNPGEGPKTDETFHGYAVLGKIDVADPEKRKEIMAALKEGIDASDGRMAKCFWPRHAIRAEQAGKVFEYVICFQCEQMEVYAGIRKQTVPIADTPQQYFNRLLTDDKVPLAPSWEELTEKRNAKRP